MEEIKRRIPLWLANLFVFSFLFCAVTAYFLWQAHQAKENFVTNVRENAVLVAEVIQLSARGSVLSKKATEEILEAFLGNSARFVDYLDQVEPFTRKELTAFAKEAGLAGIGIHKGNKMVEGPPGWLRNHSLACRPNLQFEHLEGEHLYVFSLARGANSGCVTVGISDSQIRTMQEHLGLKNVIKTLSGIPRMQYVRLEKADGSEKNSGHGPDVKILENGNFRIAEARVPMEDKTLAVALDAGYLNRAERRLWRDFFLFTAALALLGVALSMILYRHQRAHLSQVKQFERELSAERENASLGRAAAAIAHEIRNPLNTLGMGLQRLQLEGQEIDDNHQHLISLMLEGVKRANNSVGSLLRFARPKEPSKKPIRLDLLAENVLQLYARQCEASNIKVYRKITFLESILADADLLGQVMENLLKNAVEAQPRGGEIHVLIEKRDQEACLSVKNRGFPLKSEEAYRILEPYFTTKADGTGLGLTISRKIVEAHGGHISIQIPEPEMVEISVHLPLTETEKGTPSKDKGASS
ncbi:MAG: GHKL domain-containing protein [Deltaproteobacteria bacterium]|nr:GHKL domain-containing protein [Deltaproteobacteria bacterium]